LQRHPHPTRRAAAAARGSAVAAATAAARDGAELGGLDERAAEQSFRDSLDGLEACIQDGVQRLEFIGGSIEFAVKVDSTSHAADVWAADSTLGERETEKCMFNALRSVAWPAPQGGVFGIARNSFDFRPRRGVKVPAVWDAGKVSRVLARLDDRINECRGERAERLLITLYIGEGGKALGGGAASEGPVDEQAVDCIVAALLAADYPAPEQAPTKVRFQL
jgi:hypothetical protein